jgi:(p)ppGpp synthase/HD superfamily hydrolase
MELSRLLSKAIQIAAKGHENQLDKGGESYILHPLRVMMRTDTIEEKIVAVLHDVIEDTDITYEYLRLAEFPEYILEALKSVTKNKDESYMDFVRRAKLNPIGKHVKYADLIDNMNIKRIPNPTEQDYKRRDK